MMDARGYKSDDDKPGEEENAPAPLEEKFSKIASPTADYWTTVHNLESEIARRILRDRVFGAGLFSGDCWDIFLELMRAEFDGKQATLTDLTSRLYVSRTEAAGFLQRLNEAGLVDVRDNEEETEPAYSMTIEGITRMIEYFDPHIK